MKFILSLTISKVILTNIRRDIRINCTRATSDSSSGVARSVSATTRSISKHSHSTTNSMSLTIITFLLLLQQIFASLTIPIGQSAPFSGPTQNLGQRLNEGLVAAFHEQGAVRSGSEFVHLLTRDDFYEPGPALANTQDLHKNHSVIAMIGSIGTPTSQIVLPYVIENSLPFIGPFTGARFLRKPFVKSVVNLRASYIDETAAQVNFTFHALGKRDGYSVFYQADAYGNEGRLGLELALKEKGLQIRSEGTYPRNTEEVEAGIQALFTGYSSPEVIVLVGTAAPIAKAILLAAERNPNIIFISVSFVGSDALANALAASGRTDLHVYISQVVPNPFKTERPLVARYQAAMAAAHGPSYEKSFVSLEGYLNGRLLLAAMEAVPLTQNITSQSLLDAIYRTSVFTFDGLRIGPYGDECVYADDQLCSCNQGMRQVFLSHVKIVGTGAVTLEPVLDEKKEDIVFTFSTCGYEHQEYEGTSMVWLLFVLIPVVLLIAVVALFACVLCVFAFCIIHRRIKRLRHRRLIPRGEVTILFTDIQASTKLWNDLEDAVMQRTIQLHDKILKEECARFGGMPVKALGDSLMLAFSDPFKCVQFAISSQKRLLEAPWPEPLLTNENASVVLKDGQLIFRGPRVRMGFAHGSPMLTENKETGLIDYFGQEVNLSSRLESLGNGGQILTDLSTFLMFRERFSNFGTHKILGQYPLKGFEESKTVVELSDPTLPREFGALRVEQANSKEVESDGTSVGTNDSARLLMVTPKKSPRFPIRPRVEPETAAAAPHSPLAKTEQEMEEFD